MTARSLYLQGSADDQSVIRTPATSESTSFESGDSPAVFDVKAAFGGAAFGNSFEFINDGVGNIQVEISNDGTTYGSIATVKQQEVYAASNIRVASIRVTHVTDSAYRIRAL